MNTHISSVTDIRPFHISFNTNYNFPFDHWNIWIFIKFNLLYFLTSVPQRWGWTHLICNNPWKLHGILQKLNVIQLLYISFFYCHFCPCQSCCNINFHYHRRPIRFFLRPPAWSKLKNKKLKNLHKNIRLNKLNIIKYAVTANNKDEHDSIWAICDNFSNPKP